MRHLKALAIKFIVAVTVVYSILGIFETASIMEMFWISAIVTGAAYLIGDLWILPNFGNIAATISDFVLATGTVWLLSVLFIGSDIPAFTMALFVAFFLAISEAVFHIYMMEKILKPEEKEHKFQSNKLYRMQTEFSRENNVYDIRKKRRKRRRKK
ncbi:YndM family protein [Lentibacillus sediminis]|uniref:YndM family protein n=1 Tax=Lentibacillus sediminis TaxID=1940529 RepID=UPI000C1C33F4|nr:YndM family protein [Lentibacillus sediminis]